MRLLDRIQAPIRKLPRPWRWIVVAATGTACIAPGIVQLILPGPGVLMIAAGFAILAIEFTWAEIVLRRTTDRASAVTAWAKKALRRRTRDQDPGR